MRWIQKLLFAVTAIVVGGCAFAGETPRRAPNVVVFLSDDLGYGDLGCHGNPHVKTPQLDKFTRDGVEFKRFYVSPVCSPTRASLLTGRHTGRTFREVSYHMASEEVTLAESLRAAGYKTGLFGKWHLGDDAAERPVAQGFEETVTFPKGQLPVKNYFDPTLLHNGAAEKYKGYCMDVFTDCAIAFIKQNKDRPFFVYLPTNLIHEPLAAPAALIAKYEAMGLKKRLATIYAMTECTDANFGRLRAALKALGLEDNTILIFASDNGAQIRELHELERSAGLHGVKGTVYEGGIRTTCIIRWPVGFTQTNAVTQTAAHIDIFPTILESCAITSPAGVKIDGRSLLPLLRDPKAAWPARPIIIQFDTNGPPTRELAFAVIAGKWKLVQPCGADKTLTGLANLYSRLAAATGRGKRSIAGNTPRFELYDILADPGERKDLASQHPEVVAELRKQYNVWFDDVTATGRWKESKTNE